MLCDEHWVDPDMDESNGIDSIDEPSVLRLDALVMVTQVSEGERGLHSSFTPDVGTQASC